MKKVATLTPSNPAFRLQVFSPQQRADLLKQTAPKVSLKEETSNCQNGNAADDHNESEEDNDDVYIDESVKNLPVIAVDNKIL